MLSLLLQDKGMSLRKIKMKSKSADLAKELNTLYEEVCMVSERMRECNSEFIQSIHPLFEKDKKYSN